jgi:hypothetical protein
VNHVAPIFTGTPLELLHEIVAFCGPERTLAILEFSFGGIDDADVVPRSRASCASTYGGRRRRWACSPSYFAG